MTAKPLTACQGDPYGSPWQGYISKLCRGCGDVQPIDAFTRDRAKLDGLSARCRGCVALNKAKYRQVNREVIAARKAEYHQANREVIVSQMAVYYQANKVAIAARKVEYRQFNRELVAARETANIHRRRAQKNSALGGRRITATDIRYIRAQAACVYCGSLLAPSETHVEHATPLSRGGKHSLANLVSSCAECNLRKFTMTVEEWLSTDEGISRLARTNHAFTGLMVRHFAINF